MFWYVSQPATPLSLSLSLSSVLALVSLSFPMPFLFAFSLYSLSGNPWEFFYFASPLCDVNLPFLTLYNSSTLTFRPR